MKIRNFFTKNIDLDTSVSLAGIILFVCVSIPSWLVVMISDRVEIILGFSALCIVSCLVSLYIGFEVDDENT